MRTLAPAFKLRHTAYTSCMSGSTGFTPDDVAPNFWPTLIAADLDKQKLEELLQKMARDELVRFHWDYDRIADAVKGDLFLEYIDSEDEAQDVGWWLVARGEAPVREAIADPSKAPTEVPQDDRRGTSFFGVVARVYSSRFRTDVPPLGT
jgi:hypothetical protein